MDNDRPLPFDGPCAAHAAKISGPIKVPLWRSWCNRQAVRKRKARSADWRSPTPDERRWRNTVPALEDLADFWLATATIDGEFWLLLERAYSGWPDPPLYCFLAFDDAGELIAGDDFEFLPDAWTFPPGLEA